MLSILHLTFVSKEVFVHRLQKRRSHQNAHILISTASINIPRTHEAHLRAEQEDIAVLGDDSIDETLHL